MFSRSSITRAVDLLFAALKDFAACCQCGVSSFSDLGQVHPFVLAGPTAPWLFRCSFRPSVLAYLL
jgi:hypothetical protein